MAPSPATPATAPTTQREQMTKLWDANSKNKTLLTLAKEHIQNQEDDLQKSQDGIPLSDIITWTTRKTMQYGKFNYQICYAKFFFIVFTSCLSILKQLHIPDLYHVIFV